jgi:hypothetical protein
LAGVYAAIDEACKPANDLAPITLRTASAPDETIQHFIQKLHGDRLFIHGDIIRDIGFNSWENGTFWLIWSGTILYGIAAPHISKMNRKTPV